MKTFGGLLALLLFPLATRVMAAPTNGTINAVRDALKLHARQGGPQATVFSQCTVPNRVALTFDDGPYWYTEQVVDILDNAGAKGTFFVNGDNWSCIYDTEMSRQLKYAYDQGHQIGSHTWAHENLATLSWDDIHHQMWLVEQAVMRITGAYPAFMRPPFGSYNNLVLEASYIRGQHVVMWDMDSGDSVGVSIADQKDRFDDLVTNLPSTALTLQHDTQWTAVQEVLPHAITALQGAGYQLVTVAECLGMSPYQWVGAPHTRDASWVC
ncbi:chitin deacetylase [Coprinopsis cinerea AmutBmut pab1-1]|nr:chitin deacetylase [Coprinopsis cinerea AmutBmut pab1-1]